MKKLFFATVVLMMTAGLRLSAPLFAQAQVQNLTKENDDDWFKKIEVLKFTELTSFTRRGRPIPNPVYFPLLPEVYNLIANGPALLDDFTRTFINALRRTRARAAEIQGLAAEDRKLLSEKSDQMLVQLYRLGPALETVETFKALNELYRRRRTEMNVFPLRVGLAGGILRAFGPGDPARNLDELDQFLSEPLPDDINAADYYAVIDVLLKRAAGITARWSEEEIPKPDETGPKP